MSNVSVYMNGQWHPLYNQKLRPFFGSQVTYGGPTILMNTGPYTVVVRSETRFGVLIK